MDVTPVALQMGLVRGETRGLMPPIMWLDTPAGSLTVAKDCAHGPNAKVFSRNRRLATSSATTLVTDDMNINDALLGAAGPLAAYGEKWSWLDRGPRSPGLPAVSQVMSIAGGDESLLPSSPLKCCTIPRRALYWPAPYLLVLAKTAARLTRAAFRRRPGVLRR
jgi:hypothetical protein